MAFIPQTLNRNDAAILPLSAITAWQWHYHSIQIYSLAETIMRGHKFFHRLLVDDNLEIT